MTRTLTLALVLTVAAAGPAPGQEAETAPCTAAEHRQFDFWIGEWDVRTEDGERAGRNTIRPILNGCALEESWRGAQGSIGRSFNMYYARDGRWHQTWVDGNGGRLDLTGGLGPDGRMVLGGEMPGPDGATVQHEISWQALEGGRVKQQWRVSRDGGGSWRDVFVGIYHPAGESGSPPQD